MAELFNTGDVGGAGAPPATARISNPIQKPSATASIFKAATGLTQGLGGQLAAIKKEKKLAADNSILGEYAGAIDSFNQALAEGENSSQVLSDFRRVNSEFIAANPGLVKQFNQLQSAFDGTEIGEAGDAEDVQQQAFRQLRADATDEGFIREGMTDEERTNGLNLFQQDKAAQERLKRVRASQAERRAQGTFGMSVAKHQMAVGANQRSIQTHNINVAKADLEITEKREQIELRKGLAEVADTNNQKIIAATQSIVNTANNSPEGLAAAEQAIDALQLQQQEIFRKAAGPNGGALVDNAFKVQEQAFALARRQLKGELTKEAVSNQISRLKGETLLGMIETNPDILNTIVVSEAYKNNPAVLSGVTQQISGTVAQMLTATNPKSVLPNIVQGDKRDKKATVGFFKDAVNGLGKSEDPQKAKTEISNMANNLLRGVEMYTLHDKSPEAFEGAIDLVSSEEFREAVAMDLVDSETMNQTQQLISGTYSNMVEKTIRHTFNQANPAANYNVEWKGNGVVLIPKKIEESPIKNVERSRIEQRQSLEKIRPIFKVFNKLLQAGATLQEVSTKQYFEENKEKMLPLWFKAEEEVKGEE